ncbi:Rep protein [Acinetobacter junii CIP 107470 = MTCC 11364]|uniref:Rep protein n=1 Tax=Acinetobacter junii CIP 107470 = MTCC 11364 TaxID=1217666 RepID=S7Y6S5_ACIJU|nr:replication initiation protein [Acinetobacter junii]ENV52093.1 hypothetical protein F953_00505 [Acinetobacter junii CIP 107470 = MTCC 11364]EPR86869.1 Rep protein [Acinetobacter junii CIP 107470 = MTCC 11364]
MSSRIFTELQSISKSCLNAVTLRFIENLPKKPYCTDDLGFGLKINPKKYAIKQSYIQFNHPQWRKYIVIDIDNKAAIIDLIYENSHLPLPNLVIENKDNGKAHFIYELIDAVSFTENSSIKAQRYYEAVRHSLTAELGGDKAYTGLICKNPLSPEWRTHCFKDEPYHLKELAAHLDLESPGYPDLHIQTKSIEAEQISLGRNDLVFNTVRHKAYVDIREFKKIGATFQSWLKHVHDLVANNNATLVNPLPYVEVKSISKSIAKYCWKQHAECHRQFCERQKMKGKKGGRKNALKFDPVRKMARHLFLLGKAKGEISKLLDVSYRSILRYTADIQDYPRFKLTLEYIQAARKIFVHCDNSQNQVLAPVGVLFRTLAILNNLASYHLDDLYPMEDKVGIFYCFDTLKPS